MNGPLQFVARHNAMITNDIEDNKEAFSKQPVSFYFILGTIFGQMVFVVGIILAKLK